MRHEATSRSVALMRFLSGVAKRLGVAEHVYVVGGAVRNFLIDRPIKDVDVVIDPVASGRDSAWFAEQVVRAIPVETNLTTNQYGVAIVTVKGPWEFDGSDLEGEIIEIANARKESYGGGSGKGYKPHMVEPSTIEEDVIRREFNFNCMAGDTLIPTERGILRIDQVASREDGAHQSINLTVAGQAGPATAVGWQYSGYAPTLRVTTEWGHSFACTHHHPVLVLRGHDHEWVQADQLEEGDLLCVPVWQVTRQKPLTLDLHDPAQPKRGRFKDVRKPERMTPELAFLIGCVVAEGSNTHKRVSFSNSDPNLISRYAECFQATFGFRPSRNKVVEKGSVRVLRGVEFTANADGYDIYADSKAVVGWLEDLGLYCGGSKDGKSASHHKVVPWSILQADERSQWAFLAAYLEGDGSIRPDTGRITYCSASPHIRHQLQVLLGSHGVLSKVKGRFVYINSVDSALLWEKIQPWMVTKGFDYTNRDSKSRNRYGVPKEYLQGVLQGRRLRVGNNQGPSVYRTDDGGETSQGGVLEALRSPKRLLHDAHARGDFTGFMASLKAISPDEHTKLQRLFDLRYQYVEVTSVEDAGEQDVFDISMGDGVEPAFVANGVVVHNTLMWRMLDLADGPDKAEVIDLTGCGLRDLENREVRCPRDPDIVFADDPTRLLRAVKFVAKYGFKIPPDLAAAIKRNAPKMKSAPWEAIGTLLVHDVLDQPTAREALKLMKSLGLLDVVAEMVEAQRPFASYLAKQLRQDRKVDLLLDLMDLGLRADSPLSFLDREQQARLREVTTPMPEGKAEEFLALLRRPPLDNVAIIERFGLEGRDRGVIAPTARHLMLADPGLAWRPEALQRAVERRMGKQRTAGTPMDLAGYIAQRLQPLRDDGTLEDYEVEYNADEVADAVYEAMRERIEGLTDRLSTKGVRKWQVVDEDSWSDTWEAPDGSYYTADVDFPSSLDLKAIGKIDLKWLISEALEAADREARPTVKGALEDRVALRLLSNTLQQVMRDEFTEVEITGGLVEAAERHVYDNVDIEVHGDDDDMATGADPHPVVRVTMFMFPDGVRVLEYKMLYQATAIVSLDWEQYNRRASTRRTAAPEKYDHIDFKPPASVANAAQKGLEYREKQTGDKAGLTPEEASKEGIGSGVQRAVNLKNRDTLSPDTVRMMSRFFSRHEKNKSIAPEHKGEPWKDKGYVSWLLWGGDPGQSWANKIVGQMEAADEKAKAKTAAYDFLEGGNEPTDEAKWEQAKDEAKAKFDVWPSAVASAWAVRRYEQLGGGWRKKQAAVGGQVTGDGSSVGLFVRLPDWLAGQYPELDEDDSPSHTTFLIVGEVPAERRDEFLDIVSGVLADEPSPIKAWTGGVDSFVHPDKERRVYYTPIRFSRDVAEIRDRIWLELEDAGFEIRDRAPMTWFPHATLEYRPGLHHEHGYGKDAPQGSWEFDRVEVWGLPELHVVPLGSYKRSGVEMADLQDKRAAISRMGYEALVKMATTALKEAGSKMTSHTLTDPDVREATLNALARTGHVEWVGMRPEDNWWRVTEAGFNAVMGDRRFEAAVRNLKDKLRFRRSSERNAWLRRAWGSFLK